MLLSLGPLCLPLVLDMGLMDSRPHLAGGERALIWVNNLHSHLHVYLTF